MSDTGTRVPAGHTLTEADNFHIDLAELLNRRSRENVSNTPDMILAQVMIDALEAFERASAARESWYGKFMDISSGTVPRTNAEGGESDD